MNAVFQIRVQSGSKAPVQGDLVILPEINHFLSLFLGVSSPNLTRHGESIRCFRPHPGHDCQTAHAWRCKGSRLRKPPLKAATSRHQPIPATGTQSHTPGSTLYRIFSYPSWPKAHIAVGCAPIFA